MKRAALLLFLLAALARGDNAFHVNLALDVPPGASAPPNPNANKPNAPAPVVFRTRRINPGGMRIINNGGGAVVINGNVFFGNGQVQTTPPDAAPQVPTLHWKNGESLPGDVAAANDSYVSWKSPLFDDPLELKWSAIDRIDFPEASVESKDPFGISLRDGSFIYGDLVSVTPDTISIHSARHGDAVLKRSEVLGIRRRQRDKLVYAGPTGEIGWQPMTNQQDGSVTRTPNYFTDAPSPLVSAPGGAMLIRSWNRSAYLDITLPTAVDVEFHVHSSKRPEFCVALGGNLHDPLRVETWDNELVLAGPNETFKLIRRIEDTEHDVALRVCWDLTQRQCSVFDPSGNLLTSWKIPGDGTPVSAPGFIVQNRGLDLSLDMLRVRAWDGQTPARIDPKQPRVDLDDGRSLAGVIVTGKQGSITVQAPGQAATSVPLANVDAIVFSSDLPSASAQPATLTFNDGAMVLGRIAAIANGHASIATSFTSQPLDSLMDSPRQLVVNAPVPAGTPPEPSLDDLDKIVIQDTTLHGKLGASGDPSLGWMPVGGVKPARPAHTLGCEITRALPKDVPLSPDPALFYLVSGDILPGSLGSLDRTGAEFESTLMNAMKLTSSQLEAIEFSPSTRVNAQSFSDPAWQVIKGDADSLRRNGNSLEMDAGTSIGLASLMQTGDFSFKYASEGFSALRVRLFTAGNDGTHATSVLLCNSVSQFTSGLETTEGQMDNQNQIRTQGGQPVTVHFKVEDNQVELLANDVSMGQFPIDPARCAGSGVIIEPASIWGNSVFTVKLSDFASHPVPGRTWLPEVNNDIKNQVLTVPRFAKDDPPRHVLLAANGDILRGEIEAATDKQFGFRSGLEKIDIPRDRVRAVIWLQPPAKNAAAAATTPSADGPGPDPLSEHLKMRANFREVDLANVLGFLRSQIGWLKIQSPEEANQRRVGQLSIGQSTLASALAAICSHFDLHYRLDPDNTIVLETATTASGAGLTSKSYWIKPGALPATGPPHDFFSSKGISFPKDSAVDWQPESGLLTMVNTDDNQAKLAALISSDLGGSLGSPTHWIELAGGGRLAVTVDKFDPDFITAHHPAYGAIKVPMAQVAAIRTTPPELTAVSRALGDWRLVNAPEPVIPEGSSEASPLLGKDAIPFTLPLLDGGDFDLDSEKGHIVVLDFWASWCAPCIESLPEMVAAVAAFPSDRVKFIGINQAESSDQVKRFLAAHGLKFDVAMDTDQAVEHKYSADSIPRTIVVGPDGKIAWDETGFDSDSASSLTEAIKKLLDPSAPAPAPSATP